MREPDYARLDAVGLNLHAVLALDDLPAALRAALDPERRYRQLILVGNGGPALWSAIVAEGLRSPDPIDDFSVRRVEEWLAAEAGGCRHQIVYPGARPIGLQALGERAGWHYASPFMVGINARWGSWFAYRAVVLADSEFAVTPPVAAAVSPCAACRARPCVDACPAGAIGDGASGSRFDLPRCMSYRRRTDSACRATCTARLACPVKAELRYSDEQLRHSYAISLRMIEASS